ncbi:RNA polymerase sigma factor [Planctomycetota bacterium]
MDAKPANVDSAAESRVEAAYMRYANSLIAYAGMLTGDMAKAEDCVHAIFLSLFRHFLKGGKVQDTRAYLYASIRNEVKQHGYSSAREQSALENLPAAGLTSSAVTFNPMHLEKTYQALANLHFEQREVIELKYFHSLPYADIAAITGVSVNTAMSRGRLALKHLRRILSGSE